MRVKSISSTKQKSALLNPTNPMIILIIETLKFIKMKNSQKHLTKASEKPFLTTLFYLLMNLNFNIMKTKLAVLLIVTVTGLSNLFGQSINNVKAEAKGSYAIISYNLVSNSTTDVSVFYSTDNGSSFSKVKTGLRGDAGINVNPGNGKLIMWDYKECNISSFNQITNIRIMINSDDNFAFGDYKKTDAKKQSTTVNVYEYGEKIGEDIEKTVGELETMFDNMFGNY